MTFVLPLLVLALGAIALLVSAGRETLRLNGFPTRRIRDVGDLVHLMSLGYDALDHASREAARKRMSWPVM